MLSTGWLLVPKGNRDMHINADTVRSKIDINVLMRKLMYIPSHVCEVSEVDNKT